MQVLPGHPLADPKRQCQSLCRNTQKRQRQADDRAEPGLAKIINKETRTALRLRRHEHTGARTDTRRDPGRRLPPLSLSHLSYVMLYVCFPRIVPWPALYVGPELSLIIAQYLNRPYLYLYLRL